MCVVFSVFFSPDADALSIFLVQLTCLGLCSTTVYEVQLFLVVQMEGKVWLICFLSVVD